MQTSHKLLGLLLLCFIVYFITCDYDTEENQKLEDFALNGSINCLNLLNDFVVIPFAADSAMQKRRALRRAQWTFCDDSLRNHKLLLVRYVLPNYKGQDSIVYPFEKKTIENQYFFYSLGNNTGACYAENGICQGETYHLSAKIGGKEYPSVLMYSGLNQDTLSKKWVLTEFYVEVPPYIPIIRNRNLPKRFDLYSAFKEADFKIPFTRTASDQFYQ